MRNRKDIWQYIMVVVLMIVPTVAMVGIIPPGAAQAANFGGPTDNGTANYMTANWMGIGTTTPTKILHVTGTGPGTVPLFQRASDSAGFIIERTPTNRWVLGVNESAALGNGFVLSTIPTGTTSIPRLLVMQDGRVGIGTTTPNSSSQLTVYRDGGNSIFGNNTSGTGVDGVSTSGTGVSGSGAIYGVTGTASGYGTGVSGTSTGGTGLSGASTSGEGVFGSSSTYHGVHGTTSDTSGNFMGVYGTNSAGPYGYLGSYNYGAYGYNNENYGSLGNSAGAGVYGNGSVFGVDGESTGGEGVHGGSASYYGVYGVSIGNDAVRGLNSTSGNLGSLGTSTVGVYGLAVSSAGDGVQGTSNQANGTGVYGSNTSSGSTYGSLGTSTAGVQGTHSSGPYGYIGTSTDGVYGWYNSSNHGSLGSNGYGVTGTSNSVSGIGVSGTSNSSGTGVSGTSNSGWGVYGSSTSSYAGYFNGDVRVTGTLTSGVKDFKIDHPQDPQNKYLIHSTVESPDMKNIYDGTILLDGNGEATIELPSYFQALNRDFRYQLTCIGGYAPVYVAEKVKGNSFKIAGGLPSLEVSWQVTGIRQDPFAIAHPIVVEQEKPANEKGYYLHPVEWGQPKEKGIGQAPKP